MASRRSLASSVTTRLGFQSCTYGSARARERWKYEQSFESLVSDGKRLHEISYDSRLAQAKAVNWQVRCINDDQFRVLLHWYLTWHHPCNLLFDDEELFHSLLTGPNDSCSVILVHALLAYSAKSYNLSDPRINTQSIERELMSALQILWTEQKGLATAATITAHALLHGIMTTNGEDEPAIGFLESALQAAERLSNVQQSSYGMVSLQYPEAWAVWATYCEAVFSGHQRASVMKPPRLPIPGSDHKRDHRPWSTTDPNGPSRVGLSASIFRARCQIAVIIANIAATREMAADGLLPVGKRREMQQRLTVWHDELPFVLKNLHNATPQHLLLLTLYHTTTLELLRPVLHEQASDPQQVLEPAKADLSSSVSSLSALVFSYDRQYHTAPIPLGFLAPLTHLTYLAMQALTATESLFNDPGFHLRLCVGMLGRMTKSMPIAEQRLAEIRSAAAGMRVDLDAALLES